MMLGSSVMSDVGCKACKLRSGVQFLPLVLVLAFGSTDMMARKWLCHLGKLRASAQEAQALVGGRGVSGQAQAVRWGLFRAPFEECCA